MKLTIDTEAKTIEVEGNPTIGELIAELNGILGDTAMQFKIQSKTIFHQGYYGTKEGNFFVTNTDSNGTTCHSQIN